MWELATKIGAGNLRQPNNLQASAGGSPALRQNRHRQKGLTLIEIMLVLVLVVVIMGVVAVNVADSGDKGKARAAAIEVKQISAQLELFRADVGRYPTQAEGLQALNTAPSGLRRWSGPYGNKKELLDPWHNEYRYIVPGKNGASFDVISLGSDGKEGGDGWAGDIYSSEL